MLSDYRNIRYYRRDINYNMTFNKVSLSRESNAYDMRESLNSKSSEIIERARLNAIIQFAR